MFFKSVVSGSAIEWASDALEAQRPWVLIDNQLIRPCRFIVSCFAAMSDPSSRVTLSHIDLLLPLSRKVVKNHSSFMSLCSLIFRQTFALDKKHDILYCAQNRGPPPPSPLFYLSGKCNFAKGESPGTQNLFIQLKVGPDRHFQVQLEGR